MQSLENAQPSDVLFVEDAERGGNVVVGVLVYGVVGDDDAFGVWKV